MSSFKFQQNRPINQEFDFFEGGVGKGNPFKNFNLYYWKTYENDSQISAKSYHT